MLPNLTKSEMLILSEADGGPEEALGRMREVFLRKSRGHLQYVRAYCVTYNIFGFVAVLLAVMLGTFDTCAYSDVVHWLALLVAMLTTCLTFFKVETRMAQHDTTQKQYDGLILEIEKYELTSSHLRESAKDLEITIFAKFKMIQGGEPDMSLCCLR